METVKVEAKKKTSNKPRQVISDGATSNSNLAMYGIWAGGVYVAFIAAIVSFCLLMCCFMFLGMLFSA